MKSKKASKSRKWERKQRGIKAEKLRINKWARTRRWRKRKELQSTTDWGVLTPDEQRRREFKALLEIEREREAELAKLSES